MPKNGVGIVNLASGQATTVAEHVKSFRVPDDTPQIVVYLTRRGGAGRGHGRTAARRPKTREKKRIGTDLVIRDLSRAHRRRLRKSATTRSSKDGAWLVYAVSSKTPANDGAFARSIGERCRRGRC